MNAVHGVFPGAVSVIASIVTSEAITIAAHVGTPLINRTTHYDAFTGEFTEELYERAADASPFTELTDYRALCGYVDTDEWPTC
jgi:adenylyltransferase/sulfurtransferase